jgi:hypothetical protein
MYMKVSHLEWHVAHACNFTCEQCCHFSNHGHNVPVRYEEIEQWYNNWAHRIEPATIDILGGEPLLNKRISERNLYSFFYEGLKPGKRDKQTRARSIQGRMQQSMVYFPKGDDTVQIMVNEMLRFPMGVHDDCVDSLAWIGLMLDDIVSPRAPVKKPVLGWREKRLGALLSGSIRRSSMSS